MKILTIWILCVIFQQRQTKTWISIESILGKKCLNFRFDLLDWDNLCFNLTLCQITRHKFYPVITNQDHHYLWSHKSLINHFFFYSQYIKIYIICIHHSTIDIAFSIIQTFVITNSQITENNFFKRHYNKHQSSTTTNIHFIITYKNKKE